MTNPGLVAMVGRLPLQAITTQLNAEEEPTLSHKGTWKKGTVYNLLKE